MAASASFKQQCPSCEAMVPIKDPSFIGRKIDCPKCKYRFVVEDPASEEDAEEAKTSKGSKNGKAAPADKRSGNGKAATATAVKKKPGLRARRDEEEEEDEAPKKKKSGTSMTLILGIGLAAVAVILLVVGLVVLLGSGGNSPANNNPANRGASSGSGTDGGAPDENNNTPPAGPSLTDVTNLLPNETQMVLSCNVDRLLASSAKRLAFETAGGFVTESFQKKMGIPVEEVTRMVTAVKDPQSPEGWTFGVLRTAKPVKLETLVQSLGLVKDAKSPIEGQDFYTVTGEIDSFTRFLLADPQPSKPLNFHYYDDQTLIFASAAPMQAFLTAKRQPKFLTQPSGSGSATDSNNNPSNEGGPAGMPAGMMPPGGGSGPPAGMMPPGGGSGPPAGKGAPPGMTPPAGGAGGPPAGMMSPAPGGGGGPPAGMMPPGMMAPGGSGSEQAQPAASSSYMTIKTPLKTVLDLAEDVKPAPIFSLVADSEFMQKQAELSAQLGDLRQLQQIQNLDRLAAFGGAVHQFTNSKCSGTAVWELKNEDDARTTEKGLRLVAPLLAPVLGKALDMKIGVEEAPGAGFGMPSGMMPPGGGAGMMPGGPGMPGSGGPGGMMMPPGGGSGPGMMPKGPVPGGMGGPGGAGMMPPGGGRGMMPPGGGAGMMPPGAGPGGNPDQPGAKPDNEKPTSMVSIGLKDKSVTVHWDLTLSDPAYQAIVRGGEQVVVKMKGAADMTGRSRVHELAAALKAYADKNGAFPRGTVERRVAAERANLPWQPDQRVSWMASLLPFLGQGEYARVAAKIQPDKSWNEDENFYIAQMLVPQFLASDYPSATWWTPYPGMLIPVANTHFVAVAGVGIDAADYSAADPAVTKKLGVFGYDRVTLVADIKDGLEQTIALLQVPADYKTPWLAGGGSTVRGVGESGSVRPFVCVTYQGKRGTYAVMADGKVRFIPETIADETFQALCTIKGGEKIANLDQIAPVVPAPEVKTELKAALPPAPASTPVVPAVPGTATPTTPAAPAASIPPGAPAGLPMAPRN